MRFLHTSDWHLGKKYYNRDRWDEQKEVLQEILSIANQEKVDAILVAGDVYDQSNPPHEADKLLYQVLPQFSKKGERPVFIIAGNHDSSTKIEAPKFLTEELSIFFVGFNDTLIELQENSSGIRVSKSEAGFAEFYLPKYNYPLRIIFAPYSNIARIIKDFDQFSGMESFYLRDYFKKKWQELADKYCDNQGINLLMAHYTVKLSEDTSPEDYDAENPIGGNYTLYPDTFPKQIQYVALGHIHSFSVVHTKPCPLVYSSSPLCYSKKETEVQKYVVIIDLVPGKEATFKKIPLQSGKKIFFYENITFDEIENIIQQNPHHFYEFIVKSTDSTDYQIVKNELEKRYPQIIKIQVIKSEITLLQDLQEWRNFSEEELFLNYLEKVKNVNITEEHKKVLKEILSFQNEVNE